MIKKRIIFLLLTLWVLVPSFSSAVNVRNDLWDYEDLWSNNCTINSNYSFDCSESNNVIIWTDVSWYKSSSSYFWTTSWLAIYIYNQNQQDFQWYISSFLFCWENSNPLQSCNSKHNITYEEFLTYKDSHDLKAWMWYSNSSTPGWAGPAFIYDNSYIFISPNLRTSDWVVSWNWWVEFYDFWLVWYWLQANWASVPVINYPFPTPFPDTEVPNYSTDLEELTNWNILSWYNVMWLTDEFCFWWFAIDDIFQSWEIPSQFVWYRWGSGMNILDFWDIYSWAYNNDPVSFMRTFYVAYENDNYSAFYWYSKGLYWFFNQYFLVSNEWLGFRGSALATFTPMSIWEYCNLRFKWDPSATYTWNNRDAQFAWRNRDLWSNEWKFNFSWNNGFFSWSLSWFDNPSDFFGSLNAIFQWWLGDIWYKAPLLPSYILIFLFAIILVRMLSH